MELVHFADESNVRQAANWLFEEQKARILTVLPGADIQHVGSTAVPGSLTKGDLDIQVRVPAADFEKAVAALSKMYGLNDGSIQTDFFRAFQDDTLTPPLGVQLTVIGSEYDFFWKFRDAMLANPSYVEMYNQLKRHFHGKDMEAYRAAKHDFFRRLMETPEFKALNPQ
jgi:GrpB-like predicted nucleotidyltransferase (UPF0157 family)